MDLYSNVNNSIDNFIENMIKDVTHILKEEEFMTLNELIQKIKQKYTFYDFEKDPINIFATFLDKLQYKIIVKARELLNNRTEYPTIKEYYNHLYLDFKGYFNNDILDVYRCMYLDQVLTGSCGSYKLNTYSRPINNQEIYDSKTGNYIGTASNVKLFTFDI